MKVILPLAASQVPWWPRLSLNVPLEDVAAVEGDGKLVAGGIVGDVIGHFPGAARIEQAGDQLGVLVDDQVGDGVFLAPVNEDLDGVLGIDRGIAVGYRFQLGMGIHAGSGVPVTPGSMVTMSS